MSKKFSELWHKKTLIILGIRSKTQNTFVCFEYAFFQFFSIWVMYVFEENDECKLAYEICTTPSDKHTSANRLCHNYRSWKIRSMFHLSYFTLFLASLIDICKFHTLTTKVLRCEAISTYITKVYVIVQLIFTSFPNIFLF